MCRLSDLKWIVIPWHPASSARTAAAIGVSPELLSVVAGIEVREAVLVALKREPNLAGKLMTIDVSTLSFDVFEISRSETCSVCGESSAKE